MKLLYSLIVVLVIASSVNGQEGTENITQYLFPEFSIGKVLMKSGVIKQIKLNYNSLTEEMIFDTNGRFLALANPEYIDTVYIKDRKFIPSGKMFYEVPVNVKVLLLIKYISRVIPPGNPAAFGGTSETTSSTVVNNLYQSGRAYEMKLPDDFKVTNSVAFYLKTSDNIIWVNNVRQVIKCFPSKEAEIKEFVKKYKTDFDKVEDLIALVVFCNRN